MKNIYCILLYFLLFCSDQIPDDEWNLLYVAVTRAKTSLIITKNIRRILTVAGVRRYQTVHAASFPTRFCSFTHARHYIR